MADGPDEDWAVPPRVPSAPVLHLDGFDGPMDVLLDLAERQRIDLGRLSIAELTAQFLAAMAGLVGRVPLERRADWLVLATRLVLLRSRLLLATDPAAAEAAARDAAAELRRLETMAGLRRAASWLQDRPQLGLDVFARPPPATTSRDGGYVALMEACLVVLRGRAGGPTAADAIYRPPHPDLWRIPDALARIRAVLAMHPEGGPLRRFLPPIAADAPQRTLKARAAVASTFVAGLELARAGDAEAAQDGAFGEVLFSRDRGTALRIELSRSARNLSRPS